MGDLEDADASMPLADKNRIHYDATILANWLIYLRTSRTSPGGEGELRYQQQTDRKKLTRSESAIGGAGGPEPSKDVKSPLYVTGLPVLSRDTPVKTCDASHRKTTLNNTLKVLIKFALIERTTEYVGSRQDDAGYAPFLDELFQDETKKRRVTVVEGVPTVRELVSTGVNILNFNDEIFRSEKRVDKTALRTNTSPLTATAS
ncbi:hypothetical protein N0V85_008052 [Neurospora sp. IMI 360204]|nr:hypothetical protein N0V85_008052 [Neurospora sp. IMI 360204]